ncbi:hypothetical protein As57867_016096, partial [Aphanomyces stellatus]
MTRYPSVVYALGYTQGKRTQSNQSSLQVKVTIKVVYEGVNASIADQTLDAVQLQAMADALSGSRGHRPTQPQHILVTPYRERRRLLGQAHDGRGPENVHREISKRRCDVVPPRLGRGRPSLLARHESTRTSSRSTPTSSRMRCQARQDLHQTLQAEADLPSTWLVESYFQTITLDADAAISSWTVSKAAAQQPSADDNETVGSAIDHRRNWRYAEAQ